MEAGGGTLEILEGATPSRIESNAARRLAALGYHVVLKPPVGRRSSSGETADLFVNDVPYDIYSPRTLSAKNIVSEAAHKGNQARGVVLDLSQTTVTREALGNVLLRVQRAGSLLQDVIILD
jgi:filamentous hemagglutinin